MSVCDTTHGCANSCGLQLPAAGVCVCTPCSGCEDGWSDLGGPRTSLLHVHVCVPLQASEVAERLVDAQLAAGDLTGARATLRQALEARMALLGRWGVVVAAVAVCGVWVVALCRRGGRRLRLEGAN